MELHLTDNSIKIATELARDYGVSPEQVIEDALRKEALLMKKPNAAANEKKMDKALYKKLMEIGKHCAALPEYDNRTAEEIIGYDGNGLPT